ncbi:hypothetical protein INT45_004148 [Circinella minor]|uniref:C2H2-type domain-containing protein n=1 Tax=Circinella minor TaxID=1195481 RepID=A0A8H7S2G8_9FUNG|nr:hypothetical protein INT45_004148 [Circinella minor]
MPPTNQFDPYLATSFSTATSSGVNNSPALFDTQCTSFGFPTTAVTSAGATHANAFMPSPPQPQPQPATFLPPQQQQSSSSSTTTTSHTLASGSSPATSIQYSPVLFDQQLAACMDGSANKLMSTSVDDYAHSESGLSVDSCVYGRSHGSSPLAGPVASPFSLPQSHHHHHHQHQVPPPPPPPTNLSPTIPYHHHQPHHNHHGYHPYMYPGIVTGRTTEPVVQSSKRGDLRSPAMCSPAQQAQPYYHQQPTMHCQPYKRRSSAATSRSSSPTSTIHSDGGMPQNMMATFNTKVSSSTPKRYKCAVCFKKFTRPSSLTTHMYSHTGEKPFKCPVDGCGRHFSVVSNLRRHAKIHNNHPISNNNNSSSSTISSPASSSCSP